MDLTKAPLLTDFFFHIYAKTPECCIASIIIMQTGLLVPLDRNCSKTASFRGNVSQGSLPED